MSRYIDVSNLDIPSDENDYDELVAFADKIAEMIVDAPNIDIPHSDDWEKYSERLWKRAYERGKADRPQGEWIRTGRTNIYGGIEVQCSNCNDKVMVQHLEDEWYCRHCGADMRKGADDD